MVYPDPSTGDGQGKNRGDSNPKMAATKDALPGHPGFPVSSAGKPCRLMPRNKRWLAVYISRQKIVWQEFMNGYRGEK